MRIAIALQRQRVYTGVVMIRRVSGFMTAALLAASTAAAEPRQKSLEELPQDLWSIVGAPVASIARETRRFDPISGLWFGLVKGSVTSLERTADLLLQRDTPPSDHPGPSEQPLIRYAF